MMAVDALPTVAVFRTWLLPRSETFIREQAQALTRWRAVLVGEWRTGELDLGRLETRAVYSQAPNARQRALGSLWRSLGRPDPKLKRLVFEARPALIHAHFGYDGVEAWPIARVLGVPLLVTLHGGDVTIRNEVFERGRYGRRWRHYPGRLRRLADDPRVHFVAVSSSIRSAAIAKGLPPGRITVQPIGIDLARFPQSTKPFEDREPIILFVGRLVEKKGCAYLIDAFPAVKASVPDAKLVIAGDGSERQNLVRRAASLPDVSFLGAVDHGMVQQLLTQAKVLCLPSITAPDGNAEGFGMVVLEAQASGVPVVTSASGGAQEGIVEGQTGFAFPERDIATLTNRLVRILSDRSLGKALSQAGPLFVKRCFDLTQRTRELETLYSRIVSSS